MYGYKMFLAVTRNLSKTLRQFSSTGMSPDQIHALKRLVHGFPPEDFHPFVDKSETYLELLASENLIYLLHRPCAMGKTMTTNLLAYYHLDPMLFNDLKLGKKIKIEEKKWDKLQEKQKNRVLTKDEQDFSKLYTPLRFRHPHPVLYLDSKTISGEGISTDMLEQRFHYWCKEYADIFALGYTCTNLSVSFGKLLSDIKDTTGLAPVLIIDDYDHDIRYKENPLKCKHYKKYITVWKQFFTGLKDKEIHFGFMIGKGLEKDMVVRSVGKSIRDISADEKYGQILGYSLDELKKYFTNKIKKVSKDENMSEEKLIQKLTDFYGGYNFSSATQPVFCPFSINRDLSGGQFVWYSSTNSEPEYAAKSVKRFPALILQPKHVLIWETANAYKKSSFQYALKTLWMFGYFSPKWDSQTCQLYLSITNANIADHLRNWLVRSLVPEKYRLRSYDVSIPKIVTFLNTALRTLCSVSKEEFSYRNAIFNFLYWWHESWDSMAAVPEHNEIIVSFDALRLIIGLEICRTTSDKVGEAAERGMELIKPKRLHTRFLGLKDERKVYVLALSIDPSTKQINEFFSSQVCADGEEVAGEEKFVDLRKEIARAVEGRKEEEERGSDIDSGGDEQIKA